MASSIPRVDPDRFKRERFRFFTPVSSRWGDCDMFGHVNNVRFLSYYETARLDYFEKVLQQGIGPNPKEALIVADIHINYLKQMHHPCQFEVATRIGRLGNSSFDVEAAIFAVSDSSQYSVVRVGCVWFDYRANRSIRIPDSARQTIQQFEETNL